MKNIRFIKSLLVLLLLLSSCSKAGDEVRVFNHIDDVRQARIGVVLGTLQDDFATNEMPDAEVVRFETEADLILSLQQKKCDVIMLDQTIFDFLKLQNPEIVQVPSDLSSEYYGIGFNKKDLQLHAQFNDFLKEIQSNGIYQDIYDRWIKNSLDSDMPEISSYTKGKQLRVAVTNTLYPFAFMKDQKLVGFDIELIMRFAQKIQRPIEFHAVNFSSLIASLQSGRVDIISSAMCITEERQKMVLFSDPYFETRTVVVAIPHSGAQAFVGEQFWLSIKESFVSNILAEKRYLLILDGLKATVIISFFSLLLGTLLGGLICFMRMCKTRWIRNVASVYISLMRGMPVLVLLMLMFYVFLSDLPLNGIQVAIITFALNFSAYVSEMFRTAIEGVDRGQTEAGIALGFTPVQTFCNIVMPQAIKNVLPVYKGEMISLIKMTSIVGYIAVEDLTKMSDIIRSRTFDAFFPLIVVAILYFILAWIFGKALDLLNPKQQTES